MVVIVGGIDTKTDIFGANLYDYLEKLNYSNIVFSGSASDAANLQEHVDDVVILPNIIDSRLHIVEDHLKEYLTNLYQQDIEGKEDIKNLYDITANQIFPTPYIVNRALPLIDASFRW